MRGKTFAKKTVDGSLRVLSSSYLERAQKTRRIPNGRERRRKRLSGVAGSGSKRGIAGPNDNGWHRLDFASTIVTSNSPSTGIAPRCRDDLAVKWRYSITTRFLFGTNRSWNHYYSGNDSAWPTRAANTVSKYSRTRYERESRDGQRESTRLQHSLMSFFDIIMIFADAADLFLSDCSCIFDLLSLNSFFRFIPRALRDNDAPSSNIRHVP